MKTKLALLILTAGLLGSAVQAQTTFSVSGDAEAGGIGGVSSVSNTGALPTTATLTDSVTSPGWGAASYTGTASGNLVSITGTAQATSAVGDGFGRTGLGDIAVTSQFFDSLTFTNPGSGTITARFTLHLQDNLSTTSVGDAQAQLNLSLFPAPNLGFFNTGLFDYDSIGTGFGPSILDASGLYFIPAGATVRFGVQLVATAVAHFGTDFSIPSNPTFGTSVSINGASGFLSVELLTDGAGFTSASGASYVVPSTTPVSLSAVPEPSTYGFMGAALLGGIVALRRRQAKLAGAAV